MPDAALFEMIPMAFLTKTQACDNCGTDLAEIETEIADGSHEFCSEDCKTAYADEHDHTEDDDAAADNAENVCEFC